MSGKVLVIINPTANGGRSMAQVPRIETALASYGVDYKIHISESPESPPQIARKGIEDGYEIIVAGGGDGTSHMVGSALVNSPAILGLIPLGRGNDFSLALGIPRDPVEACKVLLEGRPIALDVGCNDKGSYFINMAGAGFDSEVNRYGNQVHWIKGGAVYYYAAIVQIFRFKAAQFTLVHDGGTWRGKALMIGIGNSPQYGGGMHLTPHAKLNDGLFDIVVVGDLGKVDFLQTLPKVFKGRHLENRKVFEFKTRRIEISCDAPYCSYADGDFYADLPMNLEVLPGVLRTQLPLIKPDSVL